MSKNSQLQIKFTGPYKKACNTTDSKNRLPNHYEIRTIFRTFQAENRGIFRNSQLQIKFTGSYKKNVVFVQVDIGI